MRSFAIMPFEVFGLAIGYIIYGLSVLFAARYHAKKTSCMAKFYNEEMNIVDIPRGYFVDTIGVDMWLFIEGNLTLMTAFITIIWFREYQMSWKIKSHKPYYAMNVIVIAISLFQIVWSIIGAILIWSQCPHIESTNNLTLAFVCILITAVNISKSNRIAFFGMLECYDCNVFCNDYIL